MAARPTHLLVGYALGATMAAVPLLVGGAHAGVAAAVLLAGARLGCMAPDWLEISRKVGDTRLCLIPHRTITHWVPGWVLLVVAGLTISATSAFWAGLAVVAFGAGALSHVLLDAFTPVGVPWLSPFTPVPLRR